MKILLIFLENMDCFKTTSFFCSKFFGLGVLSLPPPPLYRLHVNKDTFEASNCEEIRQVIQIGICNKSNDRCNYLNVYDSFVLHSVLKPWISILKSQLNKYFMKQCKRGEQKEIQINLYFGGNLITWWNFYKFPIDKRNF